MLTQFGKMMRMIRVNRGMILKEMAEILGVSPAFLSAVETGKKNVPLKWIDSIALIFSLTEQEKQDVDKAARESITTMRINSLHAGQTQRNAAVVFARNFDSMSNEDAQKIINMFSQGK